MKTKETVPTEKSPEQVRAENELKLVIDAAHDAAIKDDYQESRQRAQRREWERRTQEDRKIADRGLTLAYSIVPLFKAAGFEMVYSTEHYDGNLVSWQKDYKGTRGTSCVAVQLQMQSTTGWHSRLSGEYKLRMQLGFRERNGRFGTSAASVMKVIERVNEYIGAELERAKVARKNVRDINAAKEPVTQAIAKAFPGIVFTESHYDLVYPKVKGTIGALVETREDCFKVELNLGFTVTFYVAAATLEVSSLKMEGFVGSNLSGILGLVSSVAGSLKKVA